MADIKLKQGTTTTLEGNGSALANGAAVLANDANLANQTNLDLRAMFELVGGFGVAPVAGSALELYLVPAPDGTNFADADTSTPYLAINHYVGSFITVLAQTSAQRMTLDGVQLGARPYRAYLRNQSGQQLSAGWTLKAYGELEQSA
jgi:hypothetical protein